MKTTKQILIAAALVLVANAQPVFAQPNVPSDGSDGALNITTNTVIDLSHASYGMWDQNNSTNAGHGVYDPTKWAVVFKYSSINIATGATVTFLNHPSHAPVVWLVQSNATINGDVSLNGKNIETAYPNRLLPTEPGPGGFRGGALGNGAGAGFGPGGSSDPNGYGASYGSGYGNPQVLPLIGGSGGAASSWGGWYGPFAGPSGGGAILVAAGTTVTLNGNITALGAGVQFGGVIDGSPRDYSGDGAIRIIADQIQGSGGINAGGGRTRTEANSVSPTLVITPNTIAVPPGTAPTIWPASTAPSVTVSSVNGAASPSNPLAGVATTSDVTIQTNSAVDVILEAKNFPPSGTVTLRVIPKYGYYFNVNATFVSGVFTQSLWKATTTLPNGFCVLQAHATSP